MADKHPAGNRWFKVNLHVHGEKNDPAEIVKQAREAEIGILAITDHQSFDYCDGIIAAANIPGRLLTILPGVEITSPEGVHALAIFPRNYGTVERTRLLGWLEITGSGDTRVASSKNLSDIFEKVREESGIIVVPHPFTQGIGMLDSARKLSTEVQWLECGHVGLMQVPDDKIQYVAWDEEGSWINRYVLSSANSGQIKSSSYCLAPLPELSSEEIVRADLLLQLRDHIRGALSKIDAARDSIVAAIETLSNDCKPLRERWLEAYAEHQRVLGETLRKAGVESPQELIARVNALRKEIGTIQNQKQPRLNAVNTAIDQKETVREKLLNELAGLDAALSAKRVAKAQELTNALDGKIKIEVKPFADRSSFLQALTDLCGRLATRDSQIKNRDAQLALVVSKVTPHQLAQALRNKGNLAVADEMTISLADFCGITSNTQNFLCRLADNVRLLNQLQTLSTPDVPQILVQRRGETTFADLRTGLSPGEQSAAILTLALQTRSMPLIIDQPEDELGYSYVVHLIVPKILEAKFSRQILIITHNANIPVLGDADYVLKMENRPRADSGRTCAPSSAGCFESPDVTKALIELEGGQRAFDFRRFRYAMPRNTV